MKYTSSLFILSLISLAYGYIDPKDVKSDVDYAITLASDERRGLTSDKDKLVLETFDPSDVGDDNRRRFRFPGGAIPTLEEMDNDKGIDWDKGKIYAVGGNGHKSGGYVVLTTKNYFGTNSRGPKASVHIAGGSDEKKIKLRSNEVLWLDVNLEEALHGANFVIHETTPKRK